MGCLEYFTSYALGDARVISASGEDVWNALLNCNSDFYESIETLQIIEGFDSKGWKKKRGELFKVRDRCRSRRKLGCCGAPFEVDWIITSITGNIIDYPRAVSMSLRDDVLGCISTMTFTLDLIPDDKGSCIFTASFCAVPLHWKYIVTACLHRSVTKGFWRQDMNEIEAYFHHDNTIKADQDSRDSTANSMDASGKTTESQGMNEGDSRILGTTTDGKSRGPIYLGEDARTRSVKCEHQ